MRPLADNGPCDPPRVRLLAQRTKRLRQLILVLRRHQIGRGQTPRLVHAHVKGSIGPEAESSVRFVQLRARNAQIKQNPIDFTKSLLTCDLREIAMSPMYKFNPGSRELGQTARALAKRLLIPVDTHQGRTVTSPRENLARMAGTP